jgi:coenzyme F420-reducing hydrogenase alpha subunit
MALKRSDLEKLLQGVENKDDIINQIMSLHGNTINALKAENEELKTQVLDKTKEYNELVEKTKDYDAVKQQNEELTSEINGYKASKENEQYFAILKELGYNEEFIDESIFAKIEKGKDPEEFKTNATKFIKEKPMYRAEPVTPQAGTNPSGGYKGGNIEITEGMSDEEILAVLQEAHNKK